MGMECKVQIDKNQHLIVGLPIRIVFRHFVEQEGSKNFDWTMKKLDVFFDIDYAMTTFFPEIFLSSYD